MPPMRLIVKLLARKQRKPRDGASQARGFKVFGRTDDRAQRKPLLRPVYMADAVRLFIDNDNGSAPQHGGRKLIGKFPTISHIL